jgi:transcriptional regulator with GAF, ATPase, and Fis domain
MPDVVDLTRDLAQLTELAQNPAGVDDLLARALDYMRDVVPYDLAAIFELQGQTLRMRTARGHLSSPEVLQHHLTLDRFPSIQRALETRRARALEEHDHAGDEGDPYDGVLDLPHGHSCMVVPLYSGKRDLGVITFDRTVCQRYDEPSLQLATVYGQIISMALVFAEQAALLDRYRHQLEKRNELLEEATAPESEVILARSHSPAMRRVVAMAEQVAPVDTPVLIGGETGTGKEVLARFLHARSARADGPFVTLNCAALPDDLVESELFGHVQGAFTGAAQARQGRFVTANGGHLLLDEIGDLSLGAQAKLLRVLQEGTFEPVGSDKTLKVDVRVIAATHKDLGEMVRQGTFREDLYYRLAVFPLALPPLRERDEDIALIAGEYLAAVTRRTGRGPWTLTQSVLDELRRRRWPGNVRELINVLERATILSPPGDLVVDDGPRLETPVADSDELVPLAEMERRYIERVLASTGGRIYGTGGAAEILDMNPSTLISRMDKLGVRREKKKRRRRRTA